MNPKRPMSERGAKQRAERERAMGLDPDDAASRWLEENDARPSPAPRRAPKSKLLHRWRQQQLDDRKRS